jgi:DNA-directed RNA polymerase subunit RPC12/RpoP
MKNTKSLKAKKPNFIVRLILTFLRLVGVCKRTVIPIILPALLCPQCLTNDIQIGNVVCAPCSYQVMYKET